MFAKTHSCTPACQLVPRKLSATDAGTPADPSPSPRPRTHMALEDCPPRTKGWGVSVEKRQANIPGTMARAAGRLNWDTLNCVIHEPAEPGHKAAALLFNGVFGVFPVVFKMCFYN